MTISCYEPAPMPMEEDARQAAVDLSGLLVRAPHPHLVSFVDRARALTATRMAALTVISGTRQHLLAAVGVPVWRTSRASSFCGHAILVPDEVMCVPDARSDPRFYGNPLVLDEPSIRFYAAAPLRAPGGQALGALCVFDPRPRAGLQAWETGQLTALARQAMAFTLARPSGS